MDNRRRKTFLSLIYAIFFVAASSFISILVRGNSEITMATDEVNTGGADAWSESSTREAGTRQTLKIGNAEYGFCWIPAGEFDMGSPESEEDRSEGETLHHVKLTKGFWMLETEVTQALYQEVMGTNPSSFKGNDHPVERVSWDDAKAFCEKMTERLPKGVSASLPTEAEWEYACRAGTKTAYWYGDAADSNKMNYNKGRISVKNYSANAWGLYDMHGNLYEWCLDYYGDYPMETAIDPMGPITGRPRVFSGRGGTLHNSSPLCVIRGGGWDRGRYAMKKCRSAAREGKESNSRLRDLGFRFILTCDGDERSRRRNSYDFGF